MKIRNSPVLKMDRQTLLAKIPEIPQYSERIVIRDGRIKSTSKKDIDNILKLLNDDILKSLLTGSDYDSVTKDLLS